MYVFPLILVDALTITDDSQLVAADLLRPDTTGSTAVSARLKGQLVFVVNKVKSISCSIRLSIATLILLQCGPELYQGPVEAAVHKAASSIFAASSCLNLGTRVCCM